MKAALRQGLANGLFRRYTLMGLAKAGLLSKRFVYDWALVPRPHYAYGLLHAASESKSLGHQRITAIEFGVAGGNGLLEMELYASEISQLMDIEIDVVGFDSGVGLPPPTDYRDLPYLWAPGDFGMDVSKLKSRLGASTLLLGPIADTLPAWLSDKQPDAPVGFVAIDVDLWSSTCDCLTLFEAEPLTRLPRVWVYFDDIVATIPDVGELLAIQQFNDAHEQVKIRQPFNLRANVPLNPSWAEQMWQAHTFTHPQYSELIVSSKHRELDLDSTRE